MLLHARHHAFSSRAAAYGRASETRRPRGGYRRNARSRLARPADQPDHDRVFPACRHHSRPSAVVRAVLGAPSASYGRPRRRTEAWLSILGVGSEAIEMSRLRRSLSASLAIWSGRHFLWPGRALYVGLAADTAVHAHHAIQICMSLDVPFRLRSGPRARWGEYDLAGVTPDCIHQLDGGGGRLVLLYLDPESDEGRAIMGFVGRSDFALASGRGMQRYAVSARTICCGCRSQPQRKGCRQARVCNAAEHRSFGPPAPAARPARDSISRGCSTAFRAAGVGRGCSAIGSAVVAPLSARLSREHGNSAAPLPALATVGDRRRASRCRR